MSSFKRRIYCFSESYLYFLIVMRILGHKRMVNTLVHSYLAEFGDDEYVSKIAEIDIGILS